MKLLYGTGNPAKLNGMRQWLAPLGIELIGLKDIEGPIPNVKEDGKTPLENAEKKAIAYYKAFRIPVFSCDSGLYIERIPEEEQPGIHVRTINGIYLTDDQMLEHYTGLAKKYGELKAQYRNAVCFVLDEEHIYKEMAADMGSETFIIASKPHADAIRNPGFPIDRISIDIKTGKYFYDLEENKSDKAAGEEGFVRFFKEIVQECE